MERIVSLVPSLTELVVWLGAGDRLVGRTKFCTEPPEMVARVPAVGGTKDPDVAAIERLEPTLVIANKEENRREDVAALRERGMEVLVTDPNTVEAAAEMVDAIGEALGMPERASQLAGEIRAEAGEEAVRKRVFVAAWWKPLMAMGGETFGSDVLRCAGGENVCGQLSRYPELDIEELERLRPDLILLPDEPFVFKERHLPPFEAIAPARIIDGKLLWWYGPRLPESIRTLRRLIADQAE